MTDRPRDDLPDDLDRLFSRLEPIAPPPDFTARVLTRARAAEARRLRRTWLLWAAIDAVAVVLLAWAAFDLGRMLAAGPWREVGARLLLDLEFALASPAEWLLALNEVTPFVSLAGLLAASVAVALTTRALLVETAGPAGAG